MNKKYENRSEFIKELNRYLPKKGKENDVDSIGWNTTPQESAHGLCLMQNYPKHNSDLVELNGYRDLTEFKTFKKNKTL